MSEIETHSRAAEKEHVRRLQNTEHLASKPFLGGTGLSVERARMEISIFASMLASLPCGPGSTILDLGAGCCWFSEWLQKLRYRTISVDICEDMLAVGRRRLQPGSWLCVADMAALPLADGSVDGAVCYGALHHVPNWRDVLREVYRVLRPGGVLILQEPGKGHSREAESIAQMEQFGVLEQDLPPAELVRAGRAAGFSRVIVRPLAELSMGLTRILPPYPFLRQAPRLFFRRRMRRLKGDLMETFLNRVSPLHVVVACKGEVSADSSCPDTMVAAFREVEMPASVDGGGSVPFRIKVLNTGQTRWLAKGKLGPLGQVRLGISLYRSPGDLVNLDHARFDLPADVAPGGMLDLSGDVAVPDGMREAVFRFDLVSEGIAWFSEKGSRPVYRSCRRSMGGPVQTNGAGGK